MKISVLPGVLLLAVLPSTVWGEIPAGAEFRVNSYTTSNQGGPAVASTADGNFVVVWTSNGQDGSYDGVFGQRFNTAGAPQGSEFRINSYTTDRQSNPAVASAANGNFVVVWQSYIQDGSGYGVFGRRFNASGSPQGSEFRVNSYTMGSQESPTVASDANGNFVIVWESSGQDGSAFGVFGRRFNASGIPQASEFRVNSYTTDYQSSPSVAADATGNFVVVWRSNGQDGSYYGVFGQRFNTAGAPQGSEFQVNSYTTSSQYAPAVASDANGNFVVVWRSIGQDVSYPYGGVFGQRFDASGLAQGSEFQVTYGSYDQYLPTVASDANGNFVVVWTSRFQQDGSAYGVFGQRFDASGAPQGSEFRVNSYTTGFQGRAAVASSSPDGDFVVVWGSFPQDGSDSGVFGQRYGDLIFKNGFESGGLSAWSSSVTDGGDLSVSVPAALASTVFGVQAFVNDTNSLYVQDETPNAENRYRARFYFDPNGFDPGEAQAHFRTRIFIAFDSSGLRVITLVLKRQSGAYSVEGRVRRNDGTRADTGFFPISDGPHFIELDWQRSTAPGASDGSLELWIDSASVGTLSAIDNDLSPVDFARMGVLAVKTGAVGTLYFDQFESRRLNFIGPE